MGRDGRSGWPRRGNRSPKQKLSADTLSMRYGVDLPAFAYDFSEYVTSAVIERASDSNELHLTMFLVGHSVVFNDYPFETISTDESVLYSWGQASKKWDMNKNRTATTKHSGLSCVLKNNDPKHSQPYRVPALWVPTGVAKDHRLHGSVEVLRCRIKGASTIYSTLSASLNSSLLIDLVRSKGGSGGSLMIKKLARSSGHKLQQQHQQSRRLMSNTVANFSAQAEPTQDVLLSFSVPWRLRSVGYGLGFTFNASTIDPWHEYSRHSFGAPSSSSLKKGALPKIHLCVAGLRPLHPIRPVGLPSLLEFVEHYVSLGVDHIFLGFMLSPHSQCWAKYRQVLSAYIEDSRVLTMASMALEGFDDAAGFGGVHLQDSYASMLFNNQCLYLSKGVADYVVLLRATELVFPVGMFRNLVLQNQASRSEKRSSGSGSRQLLAEALKNLTLPSTNLTRAQFRSTTTSPCFFKIVSVYGIPDPTDMFGDMGGPGDSSFSGDFFKSVDLVGPLIAHHWHTSIIPTRQVMAVTSRDAAVCFNWGSAASGGTASGRGSGSTHMLTIRAESVSIPRSVASVLVLGSILKKEDYTQSNKQKNADLTAAARSLFQFLRARLSKRNFPDVSAVTSTANQASASTKTTVLLALTAFKAPFWIKCDVAALRDVLFKVFG